MRLIQGPLAQLVEQLAFNQLVAGSNPARPTIFFILLCARSSIRHQLTVSNAITLQFIGNDLSRFASMTAQ